MTDIERYIKETYIKDMPKDYKSTPTELFLEKSIKKYWAKTILKEIKYYKSPILYIEDLLDELSEGMTKSNLYKKELIYSFGYDVAIDILDHLLEDLEKGGNIRDTLVPENKYI